jgi:hypothetical protein
MPDQQRQQPTPSLEDLNNSVHDLIYADSGTAAVQPDSTRGEELARKIRENIAAYRNEVSTSHRPSPQAS